MNISIKIFTLFLNHVGKRFFQDGCTSRAAVLAYTSLITVVPFMSIALITLSKIPFLQHRIQAIEDSFFAYLIPTASDAIRTYLDRFAENASTLTAIGSVLLVLTALLLITEIDSAMNHIWRVRVQRKLWLRLGVYLIVVTFGPLMVGLSFISSQYAIATIWGFLAAEPPSVFGILPYVLSIITFTLLYFLIPNTRVPFFHAAFGAVIAAILFEITKWVFAMYITYIATYHTLYGAFAAIPIFLVWLYLSWTVVLFGAEFTVALTAARSDRRISKER